MRILLLLIAGTLLATGCGSSQETGSASGTTSGSEPPTGSSTTTPPLASGLPSPTGSLSAQPLPPPPGTGDPGAVVPADLLRRVLADAAGRTGVQASAVQVLSAEGKTWNNGALGCEEPGMGYIEVLTEGYQIMVSAGGRTLDYRTSTSAFKVCGQK